MRVINGLKLYSSAEIQELLGVSTGTLTRLRRGGLLRSVQIGRTYYVSEESLRDYLNGKTTTPRPTRPREEAKTGKQRERDA